MACLNKLAIRGIRSFDDKQISVIEFFSPVTVIVGHNGSGKTTIIECLKYATTGDQPPNTRGGAFIHDPKMANEKEVKAQVKLRFHAANGTRMLAVRNLSVTAKKTGLTMKTLESILALADSDPQKGGKRGVISTKCAEMDNEIPHLLGVSKSVLENVIFCHQEDSYWPLAEPAALKKKFDDIFEATRYTKALDSIKSLRKDRVADLKADKERLDSLAREKSHADKLKSRISQLSSTVTAKELEYEQTKKEYEELVKNNSRFYESATKFRELYIKVENLQQKKQRFEQELTDYRENVKDLEGTDEVLQARLKNFDNHIAEQKQKKRHEESTRHDMEDELAKTRKTHVELVNEHGGLLAEAKEQERRLATREEFIRDLSQQCNVKGYSHSPLDKAEITDFIARLGDLQNRYKADHERVQNESHAHEEEYNQNYRKLQNELESLKLQKTNLRNQINERQSTIADLEKRLEATEALTSELRTVNGDLDDKKKRLERMRADLKAARHEEKVSLKATKARTLEDQRDALNAEVRMLSLQADARARLELRRAELKTKTAEVQNTLEVYGSKFRKLVGSIPRAETMEGEVDRTINEKEREHADLEKRANLAQIDLQQSESRLSQAKSEAKNKRDELRKYDKQLKDEIQEESLEDSLKFAQEEVRDKGQRIANADGTRGIYSTFLSVGKQRKHCVACNRHLSDEDLVVYEKYLTEQMGKETTESAVHQKRDLAVWEGVVNKLQMLLPVQASRNRLRDEELPALEREIKEIESILPSLSQKSEEASQNLGDLKRQLKDLSSMKQAATYVARAQNEAERLKVEIENLESDLSSTGSTRTADDVQAELDSLTAEIRANEREKQSIITERERQISAIRTYESDIHGLEMRENTLANQIHEKDSMEERIISLKQGVIASTATLKDMDERIANAKMPLERLEQEHQQIRGDLNGRIQTAQQAYQDLSMNVDKLDGMNKTIDRYNREKRARLLKECADNIGQCESDILEFSAKIENIADAIARIEKEINESGVSIANLRDNLRIRKLARDIEATQAEIDSYDMEEAAKAKRNFEDRYHVEKQRETDMQSKYAHIGGEISSHKSQLKTWDDDLKEFKNINQRYTDHLVKVKMSDMANNDLEKYAKALDNAIMKYHSLKMEEVNDTMRHLWNKTYQGTDIDGIKIRSDVEGGASKRSYNYRVVMTKDQVEMDMRGRCSAGQKMLASIIIRLALSDSFGQNCGILALDEPTNALDVENIDALAASLVDIINERKNHSNFQLIIITHDENFLRKLGQSDVMEYYWRVSRDSRQKSVIERQRFR